MAFECGPLEFFLKIYPDVLFAGIEKRYMLPNGLIGFIAVNAFRARIPSDDPPVHIQQEKRIILHPRGNAGGGAMPRFRGCGLVAQDQEVAHRQHVSFSRVRNIQRASIRPQQPECTFLFSPLLQRSPELRNLGLRGGLCKVAHRAADDFFARQP